MWLVERFGLGGLFAAAFAWLLNYHLKFAKDARQEYSDLLKDNIREWSSLRTLIDHLLRTHGGGE